MAIEFQRRDFADGEDLAIANSPNGRLSGCAGRSPREARPCSSSPAAGRPTRFFRALSDQALDWTRVSVTLADERRVAEDSPRLNARLVRDALLRNHAAVASFTPLADARLSESQELTAANARIANLPLPADVVVLGMGEDGHTASWLPGAEGLAEAMDPGARQLVAPIEAVDEYEPRLTLTGRVILRAQAIALEIEGEAKLRTLAAALEDGPEAEMPIRAVAPPRGKSADGVQRAALLRRIAAPTARSGLDKGAAALVQRTERVLRLDRRDRARNNPSRISTRPATSPCKDRPGASRARRRGWFPTEQRVVGRNGLHGVDELDPVGGALRLGHRLHQMPGRRIHAGVHVVRHHFFRMRGLEALAERARAVVGVPVEGRGKQSPLHDVEPERGNIRDVQSEARQGLLRRQAELVRLLEATVGVAAAIGEGHHLRARSLRLQEE